jgi:hypothetical protein
VVLSSLLFRFRLRSLVIYLGISIHHILRALVSIGHRFLDQLFMPTFVSIGHIFLDQTKTMQLHHDSGCAGSLTVVPVRLSVHLTYLLV